ncbi:hypothetical protein ThvES_00009810 [Thiovulum sp. ES]|nr:hypothetical protein ThvES_00009810 [Thiovulum sp. ES]
MIISFFVALFTTSIVLFASRKSYQKYVEERIKAGDVPMPKEDYDGLLEDDEIIEEDEKEIIKEEKKKIGVLQNKKEIFKALPINLSLLRIVSYIFLVIGFIILKDSGNLNIASYLVGVTVAIVGISISTARNGQ